MTKSLVSRTTGRVEIAPQPRPSETPVRWLSPEESFEAVALVAERVLAKLAPRPADGPAGDADRLWWLRNEVQLPVGVEFLNRAVDPQAIIRSDDIETWATSIALARWAEDFTKEIQPFLFDPNGPRPHEFPESPSDMRAGRNWFSDRVLYDIENREFRLDAIVGPGLPEPRERVDWIEGVLGYGGWERVRRVVPPRPFVPRFIDRKGRDWTIPSASGRALNPENSEWSQRVFGWLSEARRPAKHRAGPRTSDEMRARVDELSDEGKTYAQMRYALAQEFPTERIPAARTIRLWRQAKKSR